MTQSFQPKLVSLEQSPLTFDPAGTGFTTLVGIDTFGNIWTTVGVIRNDGYFLNPWIMQPRPTIEAKEEPQPEQPAPAPEAGV